MKNANIIDEFNALPHHIYVQYLNKADIVQEMGLHLDKSVIELAIQIYEKRKQSED